MYVFCGSDGKGSTCNAGNLGLIPGWEDPLEMGMVTHSSILVWRIPWTEKPGGPQSMGSKRVGHNWVTNTYSDLSENPAALAHSILCICSKTGGHRFDQTQQPCPNHAERDCEDMSALGWWASPANLHDSLCLLGRPMLVWTKKMAFPFLSTTWIIWHLKKSVCVLIGQNSLIPHSMTCHLLSSQHF